MRENMSKIQKSKHKYYNNHKVVRSGIETNSKGFLCSCNSREKDCVREAYNILNKYADILYPPEPTKQIEDNAETSIEDELEREISGLKSVKRFQQVESGAKNILFIKTNLEDPVGLAHKIVEDIKLSGVQQTRFLVRLIPVQVTCKAFVKDIVTAFQPIAEKYFTKDNSTTFSIVYNHRNNNSLKRNEVLEAVADVVFKLNPDNKVNLGGANVSILIEVIKGNALIGIVPEFIKYKKYNLLLVSENDPKVDEEITKKETDEDITKNETDGEITKKETDEEITT